MDTSKMTVSQLKEWMRQAKRQEVEAVLPFLEQDKRKGIRQLASQWLRQEELNRHKEARWERLIAMEQKLREQGYTAIAGVDEVGRGPLAGPVVAAAVILPAQIRLLELNDSKQLSASLREELAVEIKAQAVAYHVAFVDAEEIDRINVYQASKKAMTLAVQGLCHAPDYVLLDAMTIPLHISQRSIVKGDSRSASIAAASVLAKVERDTWMKQQAVRYPQYGFERNMGYGTKEHWQAIHTYGLTPLHRRSFIDGQLSLEDIMHE
ncbi:ribonuclease HII [Caldalkalibacillus uzonensis]|uniref:Ribonuclease HII n=1 Tax=Caldalkalibacillus uzonensis TaxID=353224 RepID=A0ABU0CS59_9BACI|nr:ribonuclease HII [Caldalkalibacillus uzonensis]MDQ0339250.1 ribonuclease HII [Caldalkalibacillus uzonensis]